MVFIYSEKHIKVIEVHTDERGEFTVSLPPGSYSVEGQQNNVQRVSPVQVIVEQNKITDIELNYDSGRR